MEWTQKAKEILEKIKTLRTDNDGWKLTKKTPEVNVYEKVSPHWSGTLYRVEGEVDADPEQVFFFIDPTPSGPRSKWDKAIKELQVIDTVDTNLTVVRTITHSAFGGLISARDFTDLVVNEKTDEYLATSAEAIQHPGCLPQSEFVRGRNYPCSITCNRVPGDPKKTRIVSYIQTDLGGMLPKALVESALPSNQVDFFSALRKALQEGGKWNGPVNGSS